MAIDACSLVRQRRIESGAPSLRVVRDRSLAAERAAAVVGLGAVAGRADEVLRLNHQARLVRAMRVVTDAAVLAHRLVFPQERSTLVGVAVVAGLVDGEFLDLMGPSRRAVGVMAIGACNLAFAYRVVRILERFGLLLGVAAEACFK